MVSECPYSNHLYISVSLFLYNRYECKVRNWLSTASYVYQLDCLPKKIQLDLALALLSLAKMTCHPPCKIH